MLYARFMDELLTTQAAAMALGLARGTVIRQIELGHLRGRKYGRDWFVTPEDVERYRREHLGRHGRPRKEAQG